LVTVHPRTINKVNILNNNHSRGGSYIQDGVIGLINNGNKLNKRH